MCNRSEEFHFSYFEIVLEHTFLSGLITENSTRKNCKEIAKGQTGISDGNRVFV